MRPAYVPDLTARAVGPAALVLLAACAMPPDGTSEDDLGFYEDAVASLGCDLISERDYRVVEFQAEIDREQALALSAYELAQGRAQRLEGGGIRLIEGPCAPGGGAAGRVIQIEGTG